VPYRGTAAALVDLGAGRIAAFMGTLGDVVGAHRVGTPRDLALRLHAERDRWKDIVQRVGFIGDGE